MPAPAEPPAPEPPKTELQELQMKAGQKTDDVSDNAFIHFLIYHFLRPF